MLANHKGEIPFLTLLLPFVAGIVMGFYFWSATFMVWVLAPLLVLCIAFITLNFLYQTIAVYQHRWIGGLLINGILLLVGWLSVILCSQLNQEDHFAKQPANQLLVRITNEPILKDGLLRFTAAVEQVQNHKKLTKSSGSLIFTIRDSLASKLRYGDKLLVPATYHEVDAPFNPAEFNYKQYLAHQNIYHQLFLYPAQYRIVSRNCGNPAIAYSLEVRKRLVDKLKRDISDTVAVSVASTLILGYKADLSKDILQAYSKTGTIHILSVSGGHVAIIYLLLGIVLGFLARYRHGRLIRAILIILLIWAYALLTGFSPAVCRAAVMISLLISGTTYSRYINTLNVLAVSAFFMLLNNPFLILDVGFQLSYLAVAGMVILQPLVYSWLVVDNKWLDKLWAACSVSIAAQAITFPLSALYFHQFPVYFLVSNLFIIVPAELILCAGMIYLMLPELNYVSQAIAWIIEHTIILMNKGLLFIEHAPFSSINKIWLSTVEYTLFTLSVITLFYFLFSHKTRTLLISMTGLLVLALSVSFKRVTNYQNNSIAFLNLRKHYGIIFKQGNSAAILTNLNPADKNYQYSIQPYLDSSKVNDTKVLAFDSNIKLSYLTKYRNLIQFKNKKVLLVDNHFDVEPQRPKLNIDYVYLSDNPHVSLRKLQGSFNFNLLVIDGSSIKKRIEDIVQEAKDLHLSCYVLKGNRALLVPADQTL